MLLSQEIIYKKKVEWVANQLRHMDGDIVGFQEIMHPDALRDAVRASGIYKGIQPIFATPGKGQGYPVVGIITRLPVCPAVSACMSVCKLMMCDR